MTPARRRSGLAGAIVALACALAATQAVNLVGAEETGVVVRDGRPVRLQNAAGDRPGLYLHAPVLERVARLDRRVQALPVQLTAAGPAGARPDVSATLVYRIADPWRFYRATDDGSGPLFAFASAMVRAAGPPATDGIPPAQAVPARLARMASDLGVQVVDLDVAPVPDGAGDPGRRVTDDLAAQVVHVRADGEATRREATAAADRDAAVVRGDGERQALEVRGEGDARRAAILAAAYGRDPGFARFFRRLEAYDQALDPANTTLVLSPDKGFLDLGGPGRPTPR